MRLEQDVGLEVRRVVVDSRKLDGHPIVDLAQEDVLVVADRDALELGGRRDDFEKTLELRLLRQRHREDIDRDVVDVVVGRNHAEVERGGVHCEVKKTSQGRDQSDATVFATHSRLRRRSPSSSEDP